ncbi:MAG: valine--tRNA ligase, partial [Ginsengibacter sp.]
FIEAQDSSSYKSIRNILSKQVNAESIEFTYEPMPSAITIVTGKEKIYVVSDIEIDIASQKKKLIKDLDYHKGFLNAVDKKLSNDKFVENAMPEVVDLERKKKADAEQKIMLIEQSLSAIIN